MKRGSIRSDAPGRGLLGPLRAPVRAGRQTTGPATLPPTSLAQLDRGHQVRASDHRPGDPPAPTPLAIIVGRRATLAWLSRALMKTYVATPKDRERNWLLVDAEGLTLGRLATQIADALRGKRKPTYTPHVDVGDFVVVVNAEKISVTGNKLREKMYYRHSGYPGGLKKRTLSDMLERRPEEVIRLAVRGMLPKNRLARKQLTKLKIYAGPEHPHVAQKPTKLEVTT
jgi:large subunit ribosomal protein L13